MQSNNKQGSLKQPRKYVKPDLKEKVEVIEKEDVMEEKVNVIEEKAEKNPIIEELIDEELIEEISNNMNGSDNIEKVKSDFVYDFKKIIHRDSPPEHNNDIISYFETLDNETKEQIVKQGVTLKMCMKFNKDLKIFEKDCIAFYNFSIASKYSLNEFGNNLVRCDGCGFMNNTYERSALCYRWQKFIAPSQKDVFMSCCAKIYVSLRYDSRDLTQIMQIRFGNTGRNIFGWNYEHPSEIHPFGYLTALDTKIAFGIGDKEIIDEFMGI